MTLTCLKLYVKHELKNPYLWGWSIGFMLFRLLLGYLMIGSFINELKGYGPTGEELVEAGLCHTAGIRQGGMLV